MTTYATWDPSNKATGLTLSNGNRTFTGASGWLNAKATQGKTSGKWYFEVLFSVLNSSVGVCAGGYSHYQHIGQSADGFGFYSSVNGSVTGYMEGAGVFNYLTGLPATNCVVGVAVDLDNLKIWMRGASGYGNPGGGVGDPAAGTNPAGILDSGYALYPAAGSRAASYDVTINAGQAAFSYAVPTGFSAGWYEGAASQETALEDIGLDLAAYYEGRADLATLLEAAYLLGLVDLPLSLNTLGVGLADLPAPLQAAALGLGNVPLGLSALGRRREDIALALAAVSPEVLRSLGLSLAATDGTLRQDLALTLGAIQKAPAFRAVIAQRLASIKRGAV